MRLCFKIMGSKLDEQKTFLRMMRSLHSVFAVKEKNYILMMGFTNNRLFFIRGRSNKMFVMRSVFNFKN
ncbi:hypothetical protein AR686_13800 [Chryseobacterium aquaticum subsp. greenlandense]|uniref:Uncharacterized protein n=1 Tax=Chryseobacterium aquaticum subsp. greenlandense TaxID=345663 RepID=A0A117KB61_9FLAO|nr:hypothetical protein AR686_13800 [Chryseobacterium aquaticum subsp. greenlandense]